jgi:hypothetical protein
MTEPSHDPDRRREIAHVGPVELYTPVLAASRDFFIDVMGLREVHRTDDPSGALRVPAGRARPAVHRTDRLRRRQSTGDLVLAGQLDLRPRVHRGLDRKPWCAHRDRPAQARHPAELKTIETFHTHGTPVVGEIQK